MLSCDTKSSKLDRINFELCRVNDFKFKKNVRGNAVFTLVKSRLMYKSMLNWKQFKQFKRFKNIVWE